jgi:hypothetical protein
MKQILILAGFFVVSLFPSCIKADVTILEKNYNMTVTGNDTLFYSLGTSELGDGPYIIKKPEHSQLSRIDHFGNNTGNFFYAYRYRAENGFKGNDLVELEFRDGYLNSSEEFDKLIMKLNIKVE